MAELIKTTAIVGGTSLEYRKFSKLVHVEGVEEFHHVRTIEELLALDNLTTVVYFGSARELDDFAKISEVVSERGVTQRWQ